MVLLCLFVSLFPLTLYFFFLAGLNRRDRPVLLHGVWDSLALLFGISGFLLYAVPQLLNELYIRELLAVPLEDATSEAYDDTLFKWRLLWGGYFALVAGIATLLLVLRWQARSIYNVDLQSFRDALVQTLQDLALTSRSTGTTIFLYPAESYAELVGDVITHATDSNLASAVQEGEPRPTPEALPAAPSDTPSHPPRGELTFAVFPAFCHVTLTWRAGEPALREEMEATLMRHLRHAIPADNPAVGWFIGLGSLLFGALVMMLALYVFAHLFPRRGG